jgi:hypothetical protein
LNSPNEIKNIKKMILNVRRYGNYEDLGEICKFIVSGNVIKDDTMIISAKKVLEAMKITVIENHTHKEYSDSSGLSIDLPENRLINISYRDLSMTKELKNWKNMISYIEKSFLDK